MDTCESCGSKVYNLGCVNCDETAYIYEQERLTADYGECFRCGLPMLDGRMCSASHFTVPCRQRPERGA
jgi:hypothetical protein